MLDKKLDEVSLIRPFLIVLLVLFHSFAIYSGAWSKPTDVAEVSAYRWIARAAYSIMLESFVFLSGYVWAFQRESLGRNNGYLKIVFGKFKRLIIPCIIFGILYLIMIDKGNIFKGGVLSVLGGIGHLWFLPMLFWCFVLGYPIIYKTRNPITVLSFLLVLSFFSVIPFPLRISKTFYYLFFFIGGYYCLQYKERLMASLSSKGLLIWFLFIITFISLSLLVERVDALSFFRGKSMLSRLLLREIHSMTALIYATFGTMALWLASLKIVSHHKLSTWYIELGQYCMGVYIFQQFILKYLYYQTDLSINIGSMWLPWVAFMISLVGSLLLSYTIKQI